MRLQSFTKVIVGMQDGKQSLVKTNIDYMKFYS
jgi:hypothetical protein